jgi:hypothetical protein
MKYKVLFISYFYPPCNLTASNRVAYWVKQREQEGMENFIISRNWPTEIGTFEDINQLPYEPVKIIKENSLTSVYFVSDKKNWIQSFHDYLLAKGLGISRIFTLIDIILSNVFLSLSKYKDIYHQATKILREHQDIKIVVISVGPHANLQIGHALKNKFNHIEWIADYRDEWTTRPNFKTKERLLRLINKYYEFKWLQNAHSFTYVNNTYVKRLETFLRKKGTVIENGYNPPFDIKPKEKSKKQVTFTFLGTLYHHQEINKTSELLKQYRLSSTSVTLRIFFIGSGIDTTIKTKIERAFNWCSDLVITSRVSREQTKEFIAETDFFLMFPIKNMDGVVPTKVYDYLPYYKKIVYFPKTEDSIFRLLRDVNIGILPQTIQDGVKLIQNSMESEDQKISKDSIKKYSREFAWQSMKKLLDDIAALNIPKE